MKAFKKTLVLILALILAFSLWACGSKCSSHNDGDGDGKCDECGEEIIQKELLLIDSNGKANFQIVLAEDLTTDVSTEVQLLINDLADAGVEVKRVQDTANTVEDCEVLIGNVTTRGAKYVYDEHSLGYKGYIVSLVDEKVIINGGSDEALLEALEVFAEDILGIDGDKLTSVVMKPSQSVDERQTEYKVTALKLAGADMRGYTIAVDKSLKYYLAAAESMQETVYKQTGYWLEIVDLADADKSIVLKSVPRVYSDESFKVSASNGQLIVECAFANKLSDALSSFLVTKVIGVNGEVNFEGEVFKKDISYVTYAEFGATNNKQKDNDFEAIYNAHTFANECGQKVVVEGRMTYYISHTMIDGKALSIPIYYDVDWGEMTLYIDDSTLDIHNPDHRPMSSISLFIVYPSVEKVTIGKAALAGITLNPDSKKLDLGLGKEALVQVQYSGHKMFRRRGYSSYEGSATQEIILIDANGNINAETTPTWSYDVITSAEVHHIDTEPLKVKGGTLRTIACDDSIYDVDKTLRDYYYARGFSIRRSNTTFDGVKHYIEGEITLTEQMEDKIGVAYSGFFNATQANCVTFKDCVISGRRCYTKPSHLGGGGTTGTYGIQFSFANKIVLDGCVQHNFWVKIDDNGNLLDATSEDYGALLSMDSATGWTGNQMYWGAGNSNYCKNLEFINSKISRFDAHMGLQHGKIIGSEVTGISLTGLGNMIVEDTTIYSRGANAIDLRNDYGSTWDGEILIKNTDVYLQGESPAILSYSYANWNWGYKCTFPSLTLDNVDFYDMGTREAFDEGTEILLNSGTVLSQEPGIHLNELVNVSQDNPTNAPNYMYVDYDKNGYVDGYDLNKDGTAGGVGDLKYESSKRSENTSGVQDVYSKENLNPVTPPSFIKIINNDGTDKNGDGTADGGYKFIVTKTDDDKGVSNGGFFGATRFYYTDSKYYTGTGMTTDTDDKTFVFKN